jgi:hypothetical protein
MKAAAMLFDSGHLSEVCQLRTVLPARLVCAIRYSLCVVRVRNELAAQAQSWLRHFRERKLPNLEETNMNSAKRYIASLFLTAALAIPAAMIAAPPQRASVQLRVYDSNHRDYHNWDDNENRNWGLYLNQNNRRPHEYRKANKRERNEYWNWRHEHSDDRRSDDRR